MITLFSKSLIIHLLSSECRHARCRRKSEPMAIYDVRSTPNRSLSRLSNTAFRPSVGSCHKYTRISHNINIPQNGIWQIKKKKKKCKKKKKITNEKMLALHVFYNFQVWRDTPHVGNMVVRAPEPRQHCASFPWTCIVPPWPPPPNSFHSSSLIVLMPPPPLALTWRSCSFT